MSRSRSLLALLLAGTGLTSLPAWAQSAPQTVPQALPPAGEDVGEPPAQEQDDASTQREVEISAPGSEGLEIIVQGRFIPEPVKNTSQVVSILSSEEIARTGDGDIAGALQRITGLSVNSSGFVYVRGLGDRYSLALLNGLALPSPEPLRRVVPLDIFPTSIVSSAVVQKSYSVNFPGEYGGGVINLTTAALPNENYLTLGVGISGDSETTAKLGYTYYGSKRDVLGYDDGTRNLPAALRNNGGMPVSAGVLENEDTLILQRNFDIPANVSAALSGGYATDIGDARFGVIGSLGYSNGWRTRGATQETASAGALFTSSYGVRTENRIQANGLLGFGLDLPQGHKLRFTNVYIHDTSKVARVRGVYTTPRSFEDLDSATLTGPYDALDHESNYVQRELITSQLVGEFEFGELELDARGSYSKTSRDSPYERTSRYLFDGGAGGYRVNLASPSGVNFNYLDEDVWTGGADVAYEFTGDIVAKVSAGYAYSDTARRFESFNFLYGPSITDPALAFQPIYIVLTPEVINFQNITLRQTNRIFGLAEYRGDLTVHGGYVRADVELAEGLRIEGGVRYEDGDQSLTLPDLFGDSPNGAGVATVISKKNDYWLPAATLTWNFAEDFQLRVHGSKTIARPQFRELGTIPVLDIESDRLLLGNPFITDSELYNAEARVEYYPARGERLSLAGFYKRLKNPIESISNVDPSGRLIISNANAPKADLYGAEAEIVKHFSLDSLKGDYFANRRLVLSANYTYSKSKLRVGAGDETLLFANNPNTPIVAPALSAFRDGSPLTGQSEHLVNLQFGIEDTKELSQLTVLLTYASERVTSRGANTASGPDPDIVERPGVNIDVVARQAMNIQGLPPLELKVEARNLLGTSFRETQRFPNYTVRSNVYDVGTSFAASIAAKF